MWARTRTPSSEQRNQGTHRRESERRRRVTPVFGRGAGDDVTQICLPGGVRLSRGHHDICVRSSRRGVRRRKFGFETGRVKKERGRCDSACGQVRPWIRTPLKRQRRLLDKAFKSTDGEENTRRAADSFFFPPLSSIQLFPVLSNKSHMTGKCCAPSGCDDLIRANIPTEFQQINSPVSRDSERKAQCCSDKPPFRGYSEVTFGLSEFIRARLLTDSVSGSNLWPNIFTLEDFGKRRAISHMRCL